MKRCLELAALFRTEVSGHPVMLLQSLGGITGDDRCYGVGYELHADFVSRPADMSAKGHQTGQEDLRVPIVEHDLDGLTTYHRPGDE